MDMAESVIMTSRSELPRIVNGAFFQEVGGASSEEGTGQT